VTIFCRKGKASGQREDVGKTSEGSLQNTCLQHWNSAFRKHVLPMLGKAVGAPELAPAVAGCEALGTQLFLGFGEAVGAAELAPALGSASSPGTSPGAWRSS